MNVKKVTGILLQYLIINLNDNYCHAQVTLPLYLNSKAVNHLKIIEKKNNNKSKDKTKNEFKNSVVYASMGLLKQSGNRGKRLIKVMKRARLTHLRNMKNRSNTKRLGLRIRSSLKKEDRKLNHHYPLFQGFGSH